MILEVRLTNTAAINLYERQGFKRIGIRKAYYDVEDGKEDAIVMKIRHVIGLIGNNVINTT